MADRIARIAVPVASIAGLCLVSGFASAQDQQGLFEGVGVVVAIAPTTGSLTINHEEIVGFMPPMEMLFRVDPRSLSEGIHPGDRISFKVQPKGYVIRALKVIGKDQ